MLGPREPHVLDLLAEGRSNKEIARELGVSANTVKTHLANLYAKLGARRRTEAVAAARRGGVIAPRFPRESPVRAMGADGFPG